MGTVLDLAEHRRRPRPRVRADALAPDHPVEALVAERGRPASRARHVVFAFDLGDPETYLAAERVERLFPALEWRPVLREATGLPTAPPAVVEARAAALRLPLVWPEYAGRWAETVRPAMRVAALAAERGRAAPFVLAAGRLAYCGGFALDHTEVLAEAAAAADLGLDDALGAARDPARDAVLAAAGRRLRARGADRLPALRVGRILFAGEDRVPEAALAARAPLDGLRAG